MKKVHYLILFTAIVLFNTSKTLSAEKAHGNVLKIINEEISTIKKFGKGTTRLKHRILELESEKIAIIKEKENKAFIGNVKKSKKKRSHYFKTSFNLFKRLQADGLEIIKNYPQYKGVNEIYLTLALNDQDHGNGSNVERYLLKALKKTHHQKLRHQILVHLGEYYYNKKNYKRAVYIYNDILKNQTDEWISKHYFNAAWCNLKEKNFDKSLDMLETAYELGEANNIQSLQDQIIESFHVFYITTDNLDRGIKFLKKNLKHTIQPLFKFVEFAVLQGRFKDSVEILNLLKNDIKEQKAFKHLSQFFLTAFKTYRAFSDHKNSYNMAASFYKLNKKKHFSVTPEIKEEFKEEIKGLVGFLQSALVKNVKENFANYKEEELKRIVSFFSILASIDPKNRDSYYFFQGESYYSVHLYQKAITAYKKSILNTKPLIPSKKIEKTIFNYIGTIDFAKYEEKQRLQHVEFVYTTYLKIYPKTAKSKEIYKSLFTIYLQTERAGLAESLLTSYRKYHHAEKAAIKAYVLGLLDFYITKKDAPKLSGWLFKLRSDSKFDFEKSYIMKTEEILAQILFSNYEKLEAKNDFDGATRGYEELSNSKYPRKIRARASLKNAQLLCKMNKTYDSFNWLKKSISTFENKEKKENIDSFIFLSKRYMLKHDFESSLDASEYILEKFHKLKPDYNNELFESIINTSLTLNRNLKVREYFKKREKYSVTKKLSKSMAHLITDHYLMFKSYNQLLNFYFENQNLESMNEKYFYSFKTMFWQRYKKDKVLNILKKIGSSYKPAKEFEESIQEFRALEKQKRIFLISKISIYKEKAKKGQKQVFNEEFFNHQLETRIKSLKTLNEQYVKISKKGYPEISLRSYLSLEKLYKYLGNTITNLEPQGQPKEFLVPFKKMMTQLGGQLIGESVEYKNTAEGFVNKFELFSTINGMVTKADSIRDWNLVLPIDKLIAPSALTKSMVQSITDQPKDKK